jgi:hypothetical protein
MLFLAYNKSLIKDREKTYLTAAVAAAATSITVQSTDLAPAATSSDVWADNDYMLVGEFGEEGSEIMQVNGAVTSATSVTVDRSGQSGGMRLAHPIGTPIYRLDYNRVEFNRSATDDTSGVSVLTTIRVQPDDLYTRYEDTSNTSGYGFVRFNNETTGAFSSYSDGINYEVTGNSSSRDPRTLWSMRKKVRDHLDEPSDNKLEDVDIDEALNDAQRDLAHVDILWSFYEGERSFSSVANQFAYTIPATVQKVHTISFDTQPLVMVPRSRWDVLHFDTDQTTADPTHFNVWNGEVKVWPRPASAATSTALNGAISSTTATTITVDSTSGFNRGDYYRFIIDSEVIWATASTSTTFTGCRRGMEGTTAATHSDDATVTERDIVYTCHVEPTNLIDIADRTAVPEPQILTLVAAATLAPKVGKPERIPELLQRYTGKVTELKGKYSKKQTSQFTRVKDKGELVNDSAGFLNPNDYPRSITGS